VVIQVKANGIPISDRPLDADKPLGISFNQWLIKGENSIDIDLSELQPGQPHEVSLTVGQSTVMAGQTEPAAPKVLYTLPPDAKLPFHQTVTFDAPNAPQLKLWSTEPAALDDTARQDIVKSLNTIRAALTEAVQKSDPMAVLGLQRTMIEDLALAFNFSPDDPKRLGAQRSAMKAAFDKDTDSPVGNTPEVTAKDLVFTPLADGKLVMVSRDSPGPVVEVLRGTLHFDMGAPIYGKLGGQWVPLRW
jgi:hypothetical protein